LSFEKMPLPKIDSQSLPTDFEAMEQLWTELTGYAGTHSSEETGRQLATRISQYIDYLGEQTISKKSMDAIHIAT
jgi:hypothetical protein